MRLPAALVTLVLGIVAFTTRSGATSVVAPTVDEIVGHSEAVVLGRVEATKAEWIGNRIATRVHLRVEESVKGQAVQTVTIVVPGGSVDGIAMRVMGAPRFQQGERAIVFLAAQRAGGVRPIVGLSFGKLPVVKGAEGVDEVTWPYPSKMRTARGTVPLTTALQDLRDLAAKQRRAE